MLYRHRNHESRAKIDSTWRNASGAWAAQIVHMAGIEGIGFAGVGIKIALLVCVEVVTETRSGAHHVASSWRLASRQKAPWRWIPPPGLVAGASKVGGLKKTTEVVKHREGADPSTSRKSPGRTEFEAITLERGVTHDPDFEEWANLVYSTNGDAAVSLAGVLGADGAEAQEAQPPIVTRA